MTQRIQPPERIKPFYETSEPGKELLLIEEDRVTLKQDGIEVKGKVRITQEWSPMGLYWDFTDSAVANFDFGEVEIQSGSFTAKGRLFSKGHCNVAGYIHGTLELGSDHKLDRVTFHLPDYPDLCGGKQFYDEIIQEKKTTRISWSEVAFGNDEWDIRLQPYRDIHILRRKGGESQKVVLSGVGEIRKADRSKFKRKEVKPLLEALRIFLSFAFAEWTPPLLVVGSNDVADKSCQFWSNHDISPRPYLRGWLDELHGQHLAGAFPGFMNRWSKQNWREPLTLAVTWLIEASRLSGGTEGAIAFGQIPLEMLAWLIFVDDRAIIDDNEFEKLSAASKLQMLLAQCGIPFDMPSGLTALATLATKTGYTTGPQLAAKVRNTIIHPNEKNRKLLFDWENAHSVKVSDIRWETQQLFKWYITLVLLQLVGYSGEYANRLTPRKLDKRVELVPWVSLPKAAGGENLK